ANDSAADTPNMSGSSANANKLVLAEEYIFFWFWCWIFSYFTQPYYDLVLSGVLTPTDFYGKLNRVVPALQKAIISESDKTLLDLRRKLAPEIKNSLEALFKE
ncbi:MAG: hypothetical protein WBQ36_08640, partial [Desulfobaccales bacterium]